MKPKKPALPCPFCGSTLLEDSIEDMLPNGLVGTQIVCIECMASGPYVECEEYDNSLAVDKWNSRGEKKRKEALREAVYESDVILGQYLATCLEEFNTATTSRVESLLKEYNRAISKHKETVVKE